MRRAQLKPRAKSAPCKSAIGISTPRVSKAAIAVGKSRGALLAPPALSRACHRDRDRTGQAAPLAGDAG